MRAFSAGLSVILGMSVCYLAACSSDSDASGGASGEAGETSTGGVSGKGGGSGKAGATAKAGAGGAAGDMTGAAGAAGAAAGAAGAAAECVFASDTCQSCLTDNCDTEATTCAGVHACGLGITELYDCACDPSQTTAECAAAFHTAGGDPADALIACFNAHCATACAK